MPSCNCPRRSRPRYLSRHTGGRHGRLHEAHRRGAQAEAHAAAVSRSRSRKAPSRRSGTSTGTTTRPGIYVDVVSRRAALQLARQVRVRHRLAELHPAARAGQRHDDDRPAALHGRAPKCARRTPTRTSAMSSTTARSRPAALLHELRVDALHSGGEARSGRLRRVSLTCSRRRSNVAPAQPLEIGVVGAGGIGSYYAALASHAGHQVKLLARGAHRDAIRANGLELDVQARHS